MQIPEHKLRNGLNSDFPFHFEPIEVDVGYNPRAPHRHSYFEIFLFTKSGGLHMIDFEENRIQEKQVHFLLPNQVHYIKREPQCSGFVIKFTHELFLNHSDPTAVSAPLYDLAGIGNSNLVSLKESDFNSISGLFDMIQKEYESKQHGYREMIKSYVQLVLVNLSRYIQVDPSVNADLDKGLKEFKFLLEQFYTEEHKTSFYANKLNISDEQLNKRTKAQMGKSVHELITKRLNLEAKRLLLHSGSSVKEIAFELNFQDNSYFNRWFKKLNEVSPSEFRVSAQSRYKS